MSKVTSFNFNEDSVSNLMTVIRRNTQHSSCIDVYEELLKEIKDKVVVKAAISDMNKLVEEVMLLFHQIDLMDDNRFKAKMLTDEFIQPDRFFKNSLRLTNQYLYLNAAINFLKGNTYPHPEYKFAIGNNNRLGQVWAEQHFDKGAAKQAEFANRILKENLITPETTDEELTVFREECRKVVLLWNYMPAIVKALIQTKRRSLNLDKNSKRFN